MRVTRLESLGWEIRCICLEFKRPGGIVELVMGIQGRDLGACGILCFPFVWSTWCLMSYLLGHLYRQTASSTVPIFRDAAP